MLLTTLCLAVLPTVPRCRSALCCAAVIVLPLCCAVSQRLCCALLCCAVQVKEPGMAPEGKHCLHAYLPATEPYHLWKGLKKGR